MKEHLTFFLFAFTSLFTIVNPFGAMPVFMSMTEGMERGRIIDLSRKACITAGIVMLAYRKRPMTYGEHVVFSLHVHAFWFLALLLIALLPAAAGDLLQWAVPVYGCWRMAGPAGSCLPTIPSGLRVPWKRSSTTSGSARAWRPTPGPRSSLTSVCPATSRASRVCSLAPPPNGTSRRN